MVNGDPANDRARPRVPCQHCAVDAKSVEKRWNVGGEVFHSVSGGRLAQVAVAAL